MFVNPFERMKKIREDKERVEKETKEEREKYARLGVQMGLTKLGGVVPSFMQNIISDDKKGSVPPFGMSEGSDSYVSAPMPSSGPKTTLSNDSLKDLSLPGGGGAKMAEPMSAPSTPAFDTSFDSSPSSAPMGDSHLPGNSFPSTPGFDSAPPMSGGGFSSAPSSSNYSEPTQGNTLETVRHDSSFFDIEQNAIDQIEALLNLSPGNYINTGDVEKVIEAIKDPFSSKQMFALFGDLTDTNDAATAIKAANGSGSIDIEMKKMYSYTTPYLYVIKAIINGISQISVEDKRALWDRVAIFLSATAYGKKGTDIEIIFEEELGLADPMESAKDEFKNAFAAYGIDKEPIIISLHDFRGLEFQDMNDCLLFIADLFTGVKNLKFVFELPYDSYISHFRLSSSKSWMSLFDIVVNTKADEEAIVEGEEDVFSGISGGGSTPTPSPEPAPMSMPSNMPMDSPSFAAPQMSGLPSSPGMGSSSLPDLDMSSEPVPPTSGGMGFAPPGGMAAVNNSPQNHSAVKPVTKDDDDNVIRIVINDSIRRAEQEQLEMEKIEQQQRDNQLLATTIDPSVLEDEATGQGDAPSGTDIFANFNASGYRSILAEQAGEEDVNDHPSNFRDERSYDEIKEKLTGLSDTLASKSDITVDQRLLQRGPVNEDDLDSSPPAIKISGGWEGLIK